MNPIEYGRIVGAALLYNNCIYYTVLGGHHDLYTMEAKGVLKGTKSGFVTENGYFVDRIVGLSIAEYYNQIDFKHPSFDELYSQDLKKVPLKILKFKENYTYKEK